MPDAFITRAISGIRASAWPRFIGCDSCATILLASVSSTAAEQASSAVSIARISMAQTYHCSARGRRAEVLPLRPISGVQDESCNFWSTKSLKL